MIKYTIRTLYFLFLFLLPLSAAGNQNNNFIQKSSALTQYYFAYGSNLSYDFLKERLKNGEWIDEWHKNGELVGPIPIDLGTFELCDYEFSYSLDVEPFGEEGTAGNVITKEGSKVYGVVYKMSEAHLAALDKSEDVPEAYVRVALKVHRTAQSILDNRCLPESLIAWTYVGNPKYLTSKENPDPAYVDLLVQSAKERNFPPEYIENYLLYKGEYSLIH